MSIQSLFSNAKWNKTNIRTALTKMSNVFVILFFLTSTVGVNPARAMSSVPDRIQAPLKQPGLAPSADMPGWIYHTNLQVRNNATSVGLPSGYTVSYTLDTTSLVTGGQMLANCNDLRIA
jgi:hypothetical protein